MLRGILDFFTFNIPDSFTSLWFFGEPKFPKK